MKPFDIKSGNYVEYNVTSNDKDPKSQVGDHARILKCKTIFAEGYTPNWSEEVLVIKKVKNVVPRTYVINGLNDEEIIGTFYEKELQKESQKEFRIEKVIKRNYMSANYMSNGKDIIIHLIAGLIKTDVQWNSLI